MSEILWGLYSCVPAWGEILCVLRVFHETQRLLPCGALSFAAGGPASASRVSISAHASTASSRMYSKCTLRRALIRGNPCLGGYSVS